MYLLSLLKKVLYVLNKQQRRTFIVLIILMFFAGVFESIGISIFVPLMYILIDDKSFGSNQIILKICDLLNITNQRQFLIYTFLILSIIYILKNVYLYFQNIIQNNYAYNNRSKFFKSIYSLYINKDYEYFINNNSGDIVRSIYNDVIYSFYILINFINIISECMMILIVLITLIYINFMISLMAGILLMVELFIIIKILKPILTENGKINIDNLNKFFNNIIQSVESIKEIKIYNKEAYFVKKNEIYANKLSDSDKVSSIMSVLPKLLIESFTFSVIFAILAIVTYYGVDIKLFIPPLSAFAVAAVKLLPSINRISAYVNNITYYAPNLENLYALVVSGENVYSYDNVIDGSKNSHSIEFKNEISLNNLYFKYSSSDKYIFENLSITIPVNHSIGIIGTSGEGKTTFVDLLTGLLKPEKGNILCDGHEIDDNYNEWLNIIGYIPQNTTLVNDTIRSNIAFGINNEDINDDDIWMAIKEANLLDFVAGLKDGLDTNIGERGMKLSGGQKQRIGIARALYKKPSILIFDEATSALDIETEKEVMKSINNLMKKKTIIIVAHRLSTISNCDIVYKVEKGKMFKTDSVKR